MSENLEQKIINKIKKDSLAPTPRWHFLLKEWLIWLFGGMALLVGAAAVSVMLYLSQNNDIFIYEQVGRSFWGWLLLSLPYFWILFLALFVWILFYNIKHTKRGYRYPLYVIAIFAVMASIVLGAVFSFIGLGEKIDDILGRQAPFYDSVFNPHVDVWSHPEEGRLSGLVIGLGDEGNFTLLDREKSEWRVLYAGEINQGEEIIAGQPLRAIGKVAGEHYFIAQKIMPMKPGREFFRRLGPSFMPPPPGPGQGSPQFCRQQEVFIHLLVKYPELKKALEKSLVENKILMREIGSKEDGFRPMLQSLDLADDVWREISD